jgi:hypothetical protein
MTNHSTNTPDAFDPLKAAKTISPYGYSDSSCLASLDDETLALAGRVEDFVDSFMSSPLANLLLSLEPQPANNPVIADSVSDQWLAMVMGPTLPAHLPSNRNLI